MKKLKNILLELKSNKSGFSLSEIIIATSIIGSIATVSAAQIDDAMASARDAERKANIHQVQIALALYYDDHSEYPISSSGNPTSEDWGVIKNVLENEQNMYMPEVPLDPINEDQYIFKYWSDGQTFKINYETEDPFDESPITAWGL